MIKEEKNAIKNVLEGIRDNEIEQVKDQVIFSKNMPATFEKSMFSSMNSVEKNCFSAINDSIDLMTPTINKLPDGSIVDLYTIPLNNNCFDSTVLQDITFKFRFIRSLGTNNVTDFKMEASEMSFNLPTLPLGIEFLKE